MDRKLNDSAEGGASANQAKSKEAALEKLRRMEWKRNTQDTWHLARSNNRGDGVHERKKYNKEEDNYFEGTGVQKTKKIRRPRLSEGSRTVLPGFSPSQAPAAPPQVNAWTQKKGSALFQREDEMEDEEDQLLKLVLQESLKSAEEDKKRRIERYKMTNLDLPTSTQTMCADKDWQEEYQQNVNAKTQDPDEFQEDSLESDLHFVETDVKEESPIVNQRHRSILPKARKISPQEKSPSEYKNVGLFESEKKVASSAISKTVYSNELNEDSTEVSEHEPKDNNFVEPSCHQVKYSNSNSIKKEYKTTNSSPSYVFASSNSITKRVSPMKHAHINSDDLSASLKSTLTFGDTQGIFEKMQEDSKYKQTDVPETFQAETPAYLPKALDNNAQIKPTNPSEPSETDIFLHSFIRHEPPSSLHSSEYSNTSEMSEVTQCEPNNLFTQATSKPYSPQDFNSAQCYRVQLQIEDAEQHPVMNGLVGSAPSGGIQVNGRDSSSSMSGSPLQTVTPYGSFENEIPANVRAAMQANSQIANVPYPYHYSVIESNQETLNCQLQAVQLMNQNMPPGINSSVPPQIRGVVPVNPHVGQPQYRLPNTNMVVPPFHSQTISPLLQHQIQQAQMQQMQMPRGYLPPLLNYAAIRLPQSQLATGTVESDDNTIKEQEKIINPSHQIQHSQQIPQSHAQGLTQNQQHVLQLQNHPQVISMQNQLQPNRLVETASPKQEELLQQQQQHISQGMKPQTAGKTKEELQIEYQNAILALRRVQEEMQEQAVAVATAQVQSPVSLPQAHPSWGMTPTNPAMPIAINPYYPMQMMPHVHPHLIQQSQNHSIISPPMQNLSGLMNIEPEMNPESDINMDQEQGQTLIEHKIGRGRGRLH